MPWTLGSLITSNYQYELSGPDSGLLLGHATAFLVEEITGLVMTLPDLKVNDFLPPYVHGGYPGVDFMSYRKINFKLAVLPDLIGSTSVGQDVEYLLQQLGSLVRPSSVPIYLTFLRPGYANPRFCKVVPRRREFAANNDVTTGMGRGAIELHAYDPRIYSIVSQTQSATLAIGASSSNVTCTNNGNVETGAVITLTGAWANPSFTVSGGTTSAPYSYTITIGGTMLSTDTLVIDTLNKTVTLNGVDRYDLVTSSNQWWMLQSGSNQVVANRSSSSASAAFSVQYQDAWL